MKKKIPGNLKKMQDAKRQETIDKVQIAINDLKAEGAKITIKELIATTGLARSTFSKKHVKNVLKKNKVCQYETKYHPIDSATYSLNSEEKLLQAIKENNKLKNELEERKKKYLILKNKYDSLKLDFQILNGKYHVIRKKAKIQGLKIDD